MRFATTLAIAMSALHGLASAQDISFARDVLPILSDRCFQCHGPDSKARKSDLRLDDRASVFAQRDGHPIIVAGQPGQSELIARITSAGDDAMPPRESKLALSNDEIDILRRWVAEGADWAPHWSFVAPSQPQVPTLKEPSWPRNEIDAFILARLEADGVSHATLADPAALLRRVTLDLTGLPPTPEQLRSFLADPSDVAYERVVDELLASPHYGERMAWPWLEASRYADTDGYQADPTRIAWPWRDWLVRSLNANMPFDQFTREVLAGDLIPNASLEQRLATGLLRNNAHNGEGGRIAEETRIENVFDRTETVGTVWMGMTFECARCHDHKYDPIPQRDYYRMFAFFNQTSETGGGRGGAQGLAPAMRYINNPKQRARLREVEAAISQLDLQLYQSDPQLDREQLEWETQTAKAVVLETRQMQPSTLGPWLRSKLFLPTNGDKDSMFAEEFPPERHERVVVDDNWQATQGLVDGKPHNFEQGEYTVYFHREIEASSSRRMSMSLGSDDAIKVWCNGELILENNVRRGVLANQERGDVTLRQGTNNLLVKIVNTGGRGGIYFRRIDETVAYLPASVARALATSPGKRSEQHRKTIRKHFRRTRVDGFSQREQELEVLKAERQKLQASGLAVSVMDQLPTKRHRATKILERGNYQQPREAVTADTPAFLPPLGTDSPPDRLTLANWLVSGRHPLTARVAVNRAWQTIFGRGLVATSEDFGRQGDRPSHRGLLDWLAHRFVTSGWDVKHLHRLIVTSATYRQSAAAMPSAFAEDPNNILLSRSARYRLPAWMLRDQALALSGQLVPQVGGAPVRPYQPQGIWAEATFGTIRYQPGSGEDLYRRSLYVFWRRIVGPTVFFDMPTRQQCVVKQSITNTPLHALTTMNETGFVESARKLASRTWHTRDNTTDRIAWLFRSATARTPTPAEAQVLHARLQSSLQLFESDGARAKALLTVGNSPPNADIPSHELAAYTVLASIILNLDEVLTRP